MNKVIKKSLALLICLTFIMLAVTSTSAIQVQQQDSKIEEPSSEQITATTETYTFYRHGPDGSVTPIEVEINLEEGQDINEAIDVKCRELLENDVEIQNIVDDSKNMTFGAVVYIESKGKGFHYKTCMLEKIFLRFWQWKLILPRVATLLARPLVLCRYINEDARTYFKTISPSKWISMYLGDLNKLFWRQNRNETIIGSHTVIVNSFIGITPGWTFRHFVFTPLNLRAKSFYGYGRFVIINEF